MARIIYLSEAGSIAIHSMVLIAKSEHKLNVNRISEATGSSRHHVAKVLQRLVKEGYLSSLRGPLGGFALKIPLETINLLEIYEAIEGKIENNDCPMDNQICAFDKCLMGNLVKTMTEQFREYMQSQTLNLYS